MKAIEKDIVAAIQ